jgi:hypothetical protein
VSQLTLNGKKLIFCGGMLSPYSNAAPMRGVA